MGKRCKENKTSSKSTFIELGGKLTRNSRRVHGQGTENLESIECTQEALTMQRGRKYNLEIDACEQIQNMNK